MVDTSCSAREADSSEKKTIPAGKILTDSGRERVSKKRVIDLLPAFARPL
jgi:hypothetical protein